MATRDFAIGVIFLSQIVFGILGNFSLLYHYLCLHCAGCRFRSTDLLLKHLTLAHCSVILSKGVSEMLAALGLRDFLSDAGCKLVFYLYRVGRDVSMGTICLLSVFQLITISPVNSKWAKLKVKAPKFLCACSVLCWALSLLFNSVVPVYVTARSDNRNITGKSDLGYCYVAHIEQTRRSMYIASVFFRDGLCLVLMTWANIFMVYILHRHKKRVQYLHTRNLSARASPEDTATQSIFVLVSTFVTLYALSSTFHMLLTFIDSSSLWLLKASIVISGFFPALDPYIILYYDSRVPRRCLSWIRTTKNPRLITNL